MPRSTLIGSFACTVLALLAGQATAQSNTETYEYDALGRLTVVINGEGEKTQYNYDDASNREAVDANDQFSAVWEAESLPKVVGVNVVGTNGGSFRQAGPSHGAGHMTYGPYTTGVPTGSRVATWRIKIDAVDPSDTTQVLKLDIYDATAGNVLGNLTIRRRDFAFAESFEVFELPFTMDSWRAGNSIEFRSWSRAEATISIDKIGYY